jgi:hypothetical protein
VRLGDEVGNAARNVILEVKVSPVYCKNPPPHHSSPSPLSEELLTIFLIAIILNLFSIKETIFLHGWDEWQVLTRLKHFQLHQASTRRDNKQYFCFIKKKIWYFLCLLSAQLFSLDCRGQKWGTLLGNRFRNFFLDCTVKKWILPFLFMFQALFAENIMLQQMGLPLMHTTGEWSCVLNCTMKKRILPFLFMFQALFAENIMLQQTGLPLKLTTGEWSWEEAKSKPNLYIYQLEMCLVRIATFITHERWRIAAAIKLLVDWKEQRSWILFPWWLSWVNNQARLPWRHEFRPAPAQTSQVLLWGLCSLYYWGVTFPGCEQLVNKGH